MVCEKECGRTWYYSKLQPLAQKRGFSNNRSQREIHCHGWQTGLLEDICSAEGLSFRQLCLIQRLSTEQAHVIIYRRLYSVIQAFKLPCWIGEDVELMMRSSSVCITIRKATTVLRGAERLLYGVPLPRGWPTEHSMPS